MDKTTIDFMATSFDFQPILSIIRLGITYNGIMLMFIEAKIDLTGCEVNEHKSRLIKHIRGSIP